MKILVITGGIGSGKSLVSSFFYAKQIPVYNSDARVKMMYSSNSELIKELESVLGLALIDGKGCLDKKKFAEAIFSDQAKLKAIEDIVFPFLMDDFNKWSESFEKNNIPFLIFESATILEKEYFKGFADKILIVDAPLSLRIERVMERDGFSRDEVEKRINNQKLFLNFNDAESPIQYDFLIINNNSEKLLRDKVDEIYDTLCLEENNF